MADGTGRQPGASAGRWRAFAPQSLLALEALALARWQAMAPNARGALLVSIGSFTLVVMGVIVKLVGHRIPSFEMLFFRSIVGFAFVLPLFASDPTEPFRTRHQIGHFGRGAMSAIGNACFFWTMTHMVLADAMALQFSRPLFMLPLAVLFLGETAGWRRIGVTLVGFLGILLYMRPTGSGFDGNVLVGALGALAGGLVLLFIKQLAKTEPTRVIMFYYALWNVVLSLPTALLAWVTPTPGETALLIVLGFLGISGQSLMTTGFTMGTATALVPLDYSRVIYSALLGWLLFGELPDAWSWAGMALVIAASLYLVLTDSGKRKPAKA